MNSVQFVNSLALPDLLVCGPSDLSSITWSHPEAFAVSCMLPLGAGLSLRIEEEVLVAPFRVAHRHPPWKQLAGAGRPWKECDFGIHMLGSESFPLISRVSLGKLFNFCEPEFPHL